MNLRARCFSSFFLSFILILSTNSLYSETLSKYLLRKKKKNENLRGKAKALQVPSHILYITHRKRETDTYHTDNTRVAYLTHIHTRAIIYIHSPSWVFIKEKKENNNNNWLSESPPCVFDSLYKEKCKGEEGGEEEEKKEARAWSYCRQILERV